MALLELASQEDQNCERNAFYYARELVFTNQWHKAITALKRYLDMPKASWDYERSYAMRLLGKSYEAIGDNPTAYSWYIKACAEAPSTREGWLDLAQYCYRIGSWIECYSAIQKCLGITERQFVYTSDPHSWTELPYDIGSIAAWNLKMFDDAKELAQKALSFDEKNSRILNNLRIIESSI